MNINDVLSMIGTVKSVALNFQVSVLQNAQNKLADKLSVKPTWTKDEVLSIFMEIINESIAEAMHDDSNNKNTDDYENEESFMEIDDMRKEVMDPPAGFNRR